MTVSNREIPHYHLSTTIDLHAATQWLAHRNEGRPPAERVLPAAMLLRATALSAARHPELNGFWVDDGFRPAEEVHLAVAISLRGGGLIAPAIRDADQRTLDETMEALRDLVGRTRQGSLRGSELTGATLTVTNLGDRGAESVLGVIHPPQVALVGFGRIVDRPCAVDGLVGVRPTVIATLSGDHRASDGMVGSRLLETIDELLQHPADL
jgi:pyruvate dehydrogenase E2 component (dihydrolipoamide acetyltransferase)